MDQQTEKKEKLMRLLGSLLILLFMSCSGGKSIIMVHDDRKTINGYIQEMEDYANDSLSFYKDIEGDTLVVKMATDNGPFEFVVILENDICVFQEVNIYCSPCADKYLEDVFKDKDYKFRAIDQSNYLSTTSKKVNLRISTKRTGEMTCSHLMARKLDY